MNSAATESYAVLGHGSSLLNMAGHCAGALIFGIFLFLLARDRAGSRLRGSGLTFAAAGLAFRLEPGRAVADRHAARMAGNQFRGRVPEF